MKRCTKCGEEKGLGEFHRRKASKDGRDSSCKTCRAAYYQANRERIDTRNEEWRKANPERAAEIRREADRKAARKGTKAAWRKANPEKIKSYAKTYRDRNPEKAKDNSARFRRENPDYAEQWYQSNRNDLLEKNKAYRIAHRKEIAVRMRRYRAENPDLVRASYLRRRARKSAVNFEDVDESELAIRDSGRCGICGAQLFEPIELDHIIPISRGGHHTMDNCQLAHRSCNRQKGGKLPNECSDIRPEDDTAGV